VHPYFQRANQYNTSRGTDQYWDGFQWVSKSKAQLESEQALVEAHLSGKITDHL
jgi:hypothetical protein